MNTAKKDIELSDELVILLEDDKAIQKNFNDLFIDLDIELNLIICSTPKEYEDLIARDGIRNQLRAIIMDLSNTPTEVSSKDYKAAEYINEEYVKNRIPIFVHSANLAHYTDLEDKGTVFKFPKSKLSAKEICGNIKQMHESEFLKIFCIGGLLEEKIMKEIHTAFVEQFKGKEINQIIESIKSVSPEEHNTRTIEVFERIGIRAVFENWISAKLVDDSFEEVKLNSIEHYFRRTSDYKIWTGDIFSNNDTPDSFCIVLTPRCNIGHENFDEVLLCKISNISESVIKEFTSSKISDKRTGETKGQKSFRTGITDDVTNNRIGERYRFLPRKYCIKCVNVLSISIFFRKALKKRGAF